jgi:hypothetical protein
LLAVGSNDFIHVLADGHYCGRQLLIGYYLWAYPATEWKFCHYFCSGVL